MKKLYAQGYLRLSMLGVGVGCLIFLYGCYTSIKSNVKGNELLIIFGIGLILLTIYKLQTIFPYTWVKYGNIYFDKRAEDSPYRTYVLHEKSK